MNLKRRNYDEETLTECTRDEGPACFEATISTVVSTGPPYKFLSELIIITVQYSSADTKLLICYLDHGVALLMYSCQCRFICPSNHPNPVLLFVLP